LLLLFLISLFAIRSGVSALHPPPVAPAFSPSTISYPYSTFPTFLLLYLHFLQAPTYHPLLIGQTLPPTMAPGWKPGPSKWDGGSLLTFLGSPTANGKPPTSKHTKDTSSIPMDTESPFLPRSNCCTHPCCSLFLCSSCCFQSTHYSFSHGCGQASGFNLQTQCYPTLKQPKYDQSFPSSHPLTNHPPGLNNNYQPPRPRCHSFLTGHKLV